MRLATSTSPFRRKRPSATSSLLLVRVEAMRAGSGNSKVKISNIGIISSVPTCFGPLPARRAVIRRPRSTGLLEDLSCTIESVDRGIGSGSLCRRGRIGVEGVRGFFEASPQAPPRPHFVAARRAISSPTHGLGQAEGGDGEARAAG